MFLPQEIIKQVKLRNPLTKEEVECFVEGINNNQVTDAQIAAFTMAVCLNKLTKEELVNLTLSMKNSGETIDWSFLDKPIADKHSTGGIGDLTSLMLAPMLACFDLAIPMIAGRGLGHTGGTVDKLESIPGYNTAMELDQFKQIVKDLGCGIIGQTKTIAPVDKRMYAVRDVTATTESLELITSSILSKKLAEGLNYLIMDVKTGNGAFLTTLSESEELANSIVSIGNGAGCQTMAIITDMNQPLANVGGNAVEIIEVIRYLQGDLSNSRLHEVVLALASALLQMTKIVSSAEEARTKLVQVIQSGQALEKFAKMVAAFGGPNDFIEKYEAYLPKAPLIKPVYSPVVGHVGFIDTKKLGLSIVSLGGGRAKTSDQIDHSVGLTNIVSLGEEITADKPLAIIHASNEEAYQKAAQSILDSISVTSDAGSIHSPQLIYQYIK